MVTSLMKVLFFFLLMALSSFAGLQKEVGIQYKKSAGFLAKRQQLDVHFDGVRRKDKRPVIVWVHGGAWKFGNKEHSAERKAKWLVKEGYVLVALNYRFHPRVNYAQQCHDVAAAIGWTHKNIHKYGGDGRKIVVMGHSAGAHLAALTVVDPTYLKAAKVPRASIKGCIALDGGGLDIPTHLLHAKARNKKLYHKVFGSAAAGHVKASPLSHWGKAKQPKFLIIAVAARKSTSSVAKSFQKKAGKKKCEVHLIKGKTHMSLNRDLGKKGDPPTALVEQFLKRVF